MKEIITIDGPAGAGKSFISRHISSRLGYTYLDTGAMYRAAGLFAKQNGVDVNDETMVISLLPELYLEFHEGKILMGGKDVSELIRTPEIDQLASRISSISAVRDKLTELQRDIGASGKIVAEGRDMGTVVFPDARHKFFLTASAEERAKRRMLQMDENGKKTDYNDILNAIKKRDAADSNRKTAPLKQADDAIVIDSTSMTREEVLLTMLERITR